LGLSGYYLANPADVVLFPVAERWGSTKPLQEDDIVHTTERGRRWVYKLDRLRIYVLIFRVNSTNLEWFRAFHELVNGQEVPFYFIHDTDAESAAEAVLVRKEQNFEYTEGPDPGVFGGVQSGVYDYTMTLTEEPAGAEVQE
jgi:hypothetical protein